MPPAEDRDVASTKPKAEQLIAMSNANAAISTDAVLREGCQLSARVLGGAGAFTFAAGFFVGGELVLITEGALPGETAAHFSSACVPFNGCGSSIVAGGAFSHVRNGFLISNLPHSPADQPREESAAKTR